MNKCKSMRSHVRAFWHYRLNLGYSCQAKILLSFAKFFDKRHISNLDESLILEWIQTSKKQCRFTWAQRLKAIYPFLKYCQIEDPDIKIPPREFFGSAHRRLPPYIYTDKEIHSIIAETKKLPLTYGFSSTTYYYYFCLLITTGLRPAEGFSLMDYDVNFEKKLLLVQETKFHKSRIVPIHESTVMALRQYKALRDQVFPNPCTAHFFLNKRGCPVTKSALESVFSHIREKLGLVKPYHGKLPRIYDFRHRFVCKKILHWYQKKVDVNHWLPILATYIGHVEITDTYWYISNVPELMKITAKRFEKFVNLEGSC